jgi:hypothetical protein
VLRWVGRQPIYNLRFLAFATHYEFRPIGVRGDPNAKPRVERGFRERELSFLNGRSFRNREDFDLQTRRLARPDRRPSPATHADARATRSPDPPTEPRTEAILRWDRTDRRLCLLD